MKKEFSILAYDMREGDIFVEWIDNLGVRVLREILDLPTKPGTVGSAFIRGREGRKFVVRGANGRHADWFLPTEEYGSQWIRDEDITSFTLYTAMPGNPRRRVTVEEVQASVSRYVDSVSKHNGRTWITVAGCRRIAEEIVKDLNDERE